MFKWIWSYIRKYKFMMALGLFLSSCVAAANMINPIVSGKIVDDVIYNGEVSLLIKLIAIMIACTFGKSVLRYIYQLIFEHCSQNVIRRMREDLYAHIQKMDFSWYDKSPSGNIMTLLTSDLDAVRHFIAWVLYQILENLLIYIFSISVLCTISWKLTLSFLVTAPIILFLVWRFKIQITPLHMKVRDQFAMLNTRVGENIAGNRVVKAFVREDYEINRFSKENTGYKDSVVENANVRIKYNPVIEAITGLLPIILILFGGFLVMKGEMTIGSLVTFNGLMWAFNQPINMFGNLVDNVQRFSVSAERLYELYTTKETIKNCENPIHISPDTAKGNIEFKNVTFAYNETVVLKNVSFTVKSGMTVGVLGPTGSGKSTIARLLCRYYEPTEGEILLDGINIKQYDLEDLRRVIGITMQEVFLFSDTVEGNIAFGNPEADFSRVEECATTARVKDFIDDLTDGYETVVGERGVGLSGGQRQRIALARLFLANPKVMILDDTTSAVDNETEEKIRDSIKNQASGHTVFIISHRISSFENTDLILVFNNGEIIEKGSPKELLNHNGYYSQVWNDQIGIEEESVNE